MHNPYAHVPAPAPSTPEEQRIADYESAIGPEHRLLPEALSGIRRGRIEGGLALAGVLRDLRLVPVPQDVGRGPAEPVLAPDPHHCRGPDRRDPAPGVERDTGRVRAAAVPAVHPAAYLRECAVLAARPQADRRPAAHRRRMCRNSAGRASSATAAPVPGPRPACWWASGFFGIFILGILAAIAIPAYQDYTIRAQVTEGLNLAVTREASSGGVSGRPINPGLTRRTSASDAPIGKYVTSVNVASGSVVITYGNAANTNIAGQRLVLLPGVTNDGEVVWACANASIARGRPSR